MKTMKIWLLLLVATMVATAAHARKNDDPDMRHVRLTMTDGKQVEGYIPQKYMTWVTQYSVVLADKPDAKKGKEYKAKNITKMEWLTPTEEHPEGEVWERCQTVNRYMFRAVKEECILEVLYRGKNSTIYRAHIYLPGNGVNTGGSWATWYALKPNGEERAFLFYNASLDRIPLTGIPGAQFKDKEDYDGLKAYIWAWWDKDRSLARKQINDSPSILCTLYDEWRAESGK